jgi:hypothetical protein
MCQGEAMQPDPPTVEKISTIVYMDGRVPLDEFGYTCLIQALYKRAVALNMIILGPVHHQAGSKVHRITGSTLHALTAPAIYGEYAFDNYDC